MIFDFPEVFTLLNVDKKQDDFMNNLFNGIAEYSGPTVSNYKNRKSDIRKGKAYMKLLRMGNPAETIAQNLREFYKGDEERFPNNGSDVYNLVKSCAIPDTLAEKIKKMEDAHLAMATVIVESILRPVSDQQETEPAVPEGSREELPLKTIPFFEKELEKLTGQEGDLYVDMAFHAGPTFFNDNDKAALFAELAERAARIRVIVNTGEEVKTLLARMGSRDVVYKSLGENYTSWREKAQLISLEKKKDNVIQVKTTNIPLLHRTYLIYRTFDDGATVSNGAANVAYYSYNGDIKNSGLRSCYPHDWPEFQELRSEYDYLWEQSFDDIDRLRSRSTAEMLIRSTSVVYMNDGTVNNLDNICKKIRGYIDNYQEDTEFLLYYAFHALKTLVKGADPFKCQQIIKELVDKDLEKSFWGFWGYNITNTIPSDITDDESRKFYTQIKDKAKELFSDART